MLNINFKGFEISIINSEHILFKLLAIIVLKIFEFTVQIIKYEFIDKFSKEVSERLFTIMII